MEAWGREIVAEVATCEPLQQLTVSGVTVESGVRQVRFREPLIALPTAAGTHLE